MTNRKALLVGATGLIGGYCLQALCDDSNYSEVIAVVRRPLLKTHRKLKALISDFDDLEHELSAINADDVYCCLGTTIREAGSQEAFKHVDHTLVLTIAELMKRNGAAQFLVISSMGANIDSKVFYNRTKGEMEEAMKGLNYQCLRIIRPSLLLGTREEFRFGEKIGIMLSPLLKLLLPGSLKKYRPVEAEAVAKFMVNIAHQEPVSGIHVYESDLIA